MASIRSPLIWALPGFFVENRQRKLSSTMFRKITGETPMVLALSLTTFDFGVTWSQITANDGTRQCGTDEGTASSA